MAAIATLPRPILAPSGLAPARQPGQAQPDRTGPPLHVVAPGTGWVRRHGLIRLAGLAVLGVAIVLAVAYLATTPQPTAGQVRLLDEVHVVTAGDTMWSVANEVAPAGEAATYVERLVAVNGSPVVVPGQVLELPVP